MAINSVQHRYLCNNRVYKIMHNFSYLCSKMYIMGIPENHLNVCFEQKEEQVAQRAKIAHL